MFTLAGEVVGVVVRRSVAEVLDGHVRLAVDCFDRLSLNGYVPGLQTPGGVVRFLHDHRGNPVPSPALFTPIGEGFRRAVKRFAQATGLPVVRFTGRERKLEVMRPYLDAAQTPGLVAIGVAQEVQRVMLGADRRIDRSTGVPRYGFAKADRRVTVYYFYAVDHEWGPCFVKVCTYFPYPMKLWCNGHQWVKRQLDARGIGYQSLANGFAACQDPASLPQLADRLGHQQVLALFARLLRVIPLPLTKADRAAGDDWELSMNQIEYSRTLVVDRPLTARAFFDAVIAENVGLGRPSEVSLVFDRRVQRNTPGRFRTRVVTEGVDPTLSITYKSSRVKQYLKQGRAIRIETVINQPNDIGVQRRVTHLEELGAIANGVNRRILDVQRVATGPDLSASLFEQVALPYGCDGQRTVALRYGDPRVMALMAALTLSLHHIAGFTNASLRPVVATLLGGDYRTSQMGYDLWRLRINGLIRRLPGTHRYLPTPAGVRVAVFYTKTYQRILRPLLAVDPPGTAASGRARDPQLHQALRTIDHAIDDYAASAMIAA
jgi:hypothetical protein